MINHETRLMKINSCLESNLDHSNMNFTTDGLENIILIMSNLIFQIFFPIQIQWIWLLRGFIDSLNHTNDTKEKAFHMAIFIQAPFEFISCFRMKAFPFHRRVTIIDQQKEDFCKDNQTRDDELVSWFSYSNKREVRQFWFAKSEISRRTMDMQNQWRCCRWHTTWLTIFDAANSLVSGVWIVGLPPLKNGVGKFNLLRIPTCHKHGQ